MLFSLLSGRSCLALRLRLSGQKRVPLPPARMTGWKFVLLIRSRVFLMPARGLCASIPVA